MRPNLFVNTPDILHAYLQYGGPAAFAIRATLAATMSPTWGVYSGYELFEHVPVRPGSEEYLDSEKYQYRPREWAGGREARTTRWPLHHPAQRDPPGAPRAAAAAHIVFHQIDRRPHDRLQQARRRRHSCSWWCTLDPFGPREATLHVDMPALGLDWHDRYVAQDLITGPELLVVVRRTSMRLDPHLSGCAHIMSNPTGSDLT
jgi:starch synthase (maltosyl-transferring)